MYTTASSSPAIIITLFIWLVGLGNCDSTGCGYNTTGSPTFCGASSSCVTRNGHTSCQSATPFLNYHNTTFRTSGPVSTMTSGFISVTLSSSQRINVTASFSSSLSRATSARVTDNPSNFPMFINGTTSVSTSPPAAATTNAQVTDNPSSFSTSLSPTTKLNATWSINGTTNFSKLPPAAPAATIAAALFENSINAQISLAFTNKPSATWTTATSNYTRSSTSTTSPSTTWTTTTSNSTNSLTSTTSSSAPSMDTSYNSPGSPTSTISASALSTDTSSNSSGSSTPTTKSSTTLTETSSNSLRSSTPVAKSSAVPPIDGVSSVSNSPSVATKTSPQLANNPPSLLSSPTPTTDSAATPRLSGSPSLPQQLDPILSPEEPLPSSDPIPSDPTPSDTIPSSQMASPGNTLPVVLPSTFIVIFAVAAAVIGNRKKWFALAYRHLYRGRRLRRTLTDASHGPNSFGDAIPLRDFATPPPAYSPPRASCAGQEFFGTTYPMGESQGIALYPIESTHWTISEMMDQAYPRSDKGRYRST